MCKVPESEVRLGYTRGKVRSEWSQSLVSKGARVKRDMREEVQVEAKTYNL